MSTGRRLKALADRRRGRLTAVGTLVAVGVLVVVLAGRWGHFASAAAGAPWWAFGGRRGAADLVADGAQ